MRWKLSFEVVAFLAFAAALAILPRFLSDFRAREFAIAGMYFIAVLGLAILTGYSGQISLGHGAFMAVGGYTTAILSVDHGVRPIWTIPLAGLVAGAAGLLVGLPALRLSGLYLALVTFGIAVSFPQLPKKFDHFTGGTTGKFGGEFTSNPPFGLETTPNNWMYYLTWGIALVLLAAAWFLLRGKAGRALQAIRDSEVAAASSGVSLATYKTLAFGISAFYAGVAGSLYATANAYMNPSVFPIILSVYLVAAASSGVSLATYKTLAFGISAFYAGVAGSLYATANAYMNPSVFPIILSVYLVAALAVGGIGSLNGLVAGAALIYILQNRPADVTRWLNEIPLLDLDPTKPGMSSVVFGVVLIGVIVLLPTGAGGLVRRMFGPLTTRLYTRS
jgi:branched-chain amino acid transport system permease protein